MKLTVKKVFAWIFGIVYYCYCIHQSMFLIFRGSEQLQNQMFHFRSDIPSVFHDIYSDWYQSLDNGEVVIMLYVYTTPLAIIALIYLAIYFKKNIKIRTALLLNLAPLIALPFAIVSAAVHNLLNPILFVLAAWILTILVYMAINLITSRHKAGETR